MIKITKAGKKDELGSDWQQIIDKHYGKGLSWFEKYYRYKAVEDGKLLGTIEGKVEPGCVNINALMTTEAARGKGIGTMLIKKAEDLGKKLGAHRTWLFTGKDWQSNGFYQKLGFKTIANCDDFFYHKDFVIYTRLIK
jgi:GNAT superfamily N-acetyltransferase